MEVDQEKETVIERKGKEDVKVKYADNTGKKSETSKRRIVRRKFRTFRNSRGRSNYLGRSKVNQNRNGYSFNKNQRRQRGIGGRRRGVKILIRGLTRNATNNDIKNVFEKIGPLRRCGINYNNLGESKGTAEVEFYYRRDAFKAYRKLDYKNIRGVPIRLEVREGGRKLLIRRVRTFRRGVRSYSSGARRFRTNRTGNRRDSNLRKARSVSRRNTTRRSLRNNRRNSRNDRKYKTYNN